MNRMRRAHGSGPCIYWASKSRTMRPSQEILCDTNVWYGLSSGRLPLPQATLSHSRPTILELLQVKPRPSNPDLPHKICEMFIDQLDTGYHLSPIAHMADVLGIPIPEQHVTESLKMYQGALGIIQAIGNGDVNPNDNDYSELVKALQKPTQDLHQSFIRLANAHRTKDRRIAADDLLLTKGIVVACIRSKTDVVITADELDWTKVELFVKTFNLWLKELEQTERMPKFNDYVDAFNLAYVQPGTLYWTEDTSWMSLIRSAGVQSYLYKPHASGKACR